MVVDITPDLDPSKLSLKKKIELVKQSDGLLIERMCGIGSSQRNEGWAKLHQSFINLNYDDVIFGISPDNPV